MSIQIISPLLSKGGEKKSLSLFAASVCRLRLVFTWETFPTGAAPSIALGRSRWMSCVLLSQARAQTAPRVCLFKFQLRVWETAPLAAQAGWRLRARSLVRAPAPGCAPRRARSARGLLGGGGGGGGAGRRGRAEEGRRSEPGRERRRARSRARSRAWRPQRFPLG